MLKLSDRWVQTLLLLLWLVIGALLRFALLDDKPPWNDELATLVFSLGNSLHQVPLDQPIALKTLLAPLQPNAAHSLGDVTHRLLTESTHPPVYFILTHLWLQLFPAEQGLVSVWAARSLSALFGVAAIPAMFGWGWLMFRSCWVGQLAAALMAVSPYGVYLAQEARHYTLAVLLIIASLSCLLATVQRMAQNRLPLWLCLTWVGVNSLGIAVHYFFVLMLGAEALVLLAWRFGSRSRIWWRLYSVAAGTLAAGLMWIPLWRSVSENELTQWIYDRSFLSNAIAPLYRLLSWMITMVALLPVEGVPFAITIVSGTLTFSSIIGLVWRMQAGLKRLLKQPQTQPAILTLIGLLLATVGLIFCVTYGFHADLTIAARYQFLYFPIVIAIISSAIAFEKNFVKVLLMALGVVGSLTVIANYGYQKPDRPDQLVPIIREASNVPVLIATAHQTHEQTRELMGLALEYQRQPLDSSEESSKTNPRFLLAHLDPNSNTALEQVQKTVRQTPRPFDLWLVNFLPIVQPVIQTCTLDGARYPLMHGYDYRLYHCLKN